MAVPTIRRTVTAIVAAFAGVAFAADPTAVGDQFHVNPGQLDTTDHPDIATGADGNFVVAWEGGSYDSWYPIFVRTFDADGNPVSGSVEVSPPGQLPADRSYGPALATDADGNFVVVWNQGENYEVQARRGDAAGNLSPTFTVAPVETYFFSHAVGRTPTGEFVVV